MYAVFKSGGKQYLVHKGQTIRLEKIDASIGDCVDFVKILMIRDNKKIEVGDPFVKNALIKAKIVNHGRDKKIKVVKFRRRKHYRKQQGHRQWFTDVQIINIDFLK